MRHKLLFLLAGLIIHACTPKTYTSHGERIYKTGKNANGEKLLDQKASRIPFMTTCQSCHGRSGDRMAAVSIKFRDLSDPSRLKVPYTDSLFFRFLDEDLKSDGTKANIGVIWNMTDSDKKDLLDYLKRL